MHAHMLTHTHSLEVIRPLEVVGFGLNHEQEALFEWSMEQNIWDEKQSRGVGKIIQ